MQRRTGTFLFAGLIAASIAGLDAGQPRTDGRWVTAWATSQQALSPGSTSDATLRMIARATIGGDALRIRLDNTYGTAPLTIGRASIGRRRQGASLTPGSSRQLHFAAAATATIPPGSSVVSDPVAFAVLPGEDLAVSLYLPGSEVKASQHTLALTTSYLSANGAGDLSADESRTPFTNQTTAMLVLKAVDVRSASARGAIVAFGDSITDGTCSTVDGHDRWVDWLSVRLDLDSRGRSSDRKAVVNEGIGGNTVTREGLQPPPDSAPGIERLERDVLSHHGVTDAIVFMGTNDIRRGAAPAQVTAGLEEIAKRLKARHIRVSAATIIPRHVNTGNTPWDAGKTAQRQAVNRWLRGRTPFDAIIDFDAVIQDPADKDLINPPFNCDDIHPTPRGYYEMGKAVPLQLFRR